MAAALTEGGRADGHNIARLGNGGHIYQLGTPCAQAAQGLSHIVGIELAGTRQLAREFAVDGQAAVKYAAELLLDDGLTLFDDQDGVGGVGQTLEHLLGQGILADLTVGNGLSGNTSRR